METINAPKNRPPRPKQPNPIKKFFSANLLNIILTLTLCVIAGFFILKRANQSSTQKENTLNQRGMGDSSESDSEDKSNLASRHKSFVPKRSSTKEEKMNTKDDDEPDPEFIKQHVKRLIHLMDTQIRGGELTLQRETDPKKTAEIKRRVEGAKRMREKLKSVDPENPQTWFFMKGAKKNEEKIENDWLPKEESE